MGSLPQWPNTNHASTLATVAGGGGAVNGLLLRDTHQLGRDELPSSISAASGGQRPTRSTLALEDITYLTLAPRRKLATLLLPPNSQKRSDKIHQCCQSWRMPNNIRIDSDTRHVNDAGSEKEIANARVTSNESEAIWQCSLWLSVSPSSQDNLA